MKLFGRTGGYYLFWTGFVYFCVGMYLAFTHAARPEIATAIWIFMLTLPFVFPPLGRYFNIDVEWDRKVMGFFSFLGFQKMVEDTSKVLDFPKLQSVPKMPEVTPPKKEEPAKIFYRLGLTDNNRVAFSMGYSEILMAREGCQQMIDQLKFFQSQLRDEYDGPEDDPDGGLPLPEEVENKKAA